MRSIFNIIKLVNIKKVIIFSVLISSLFALLSLVSLIYPWIYSQFIKALQYKKDFFPFLKLYVMILSCSIILEFFLIWLFGKINSQNDQKLRFFLFNKLKSMKETKIKEKGEGYFEKVMDTTLFNILRLFTPIVFIKIVSIFKYLFIIVFLFKFNNIAGLIGLISLIIYFLNYLFNKKIYIKNYKKVINNLTDFYSFFFESISMTSLFSTFPFFNRKNNEIAKKKIRNLNESVRVHEFFGDTFYRIISNFVVPILQVLMYFYLGKLYFKNQITIPQIILIIGYFSQISPIFEDINEITKFIHESNTSAYEMYEIIKNTEKNIIKKIIYPEINFFLKFKNLSIYYKNKAVLKNINIKLDMGKIYGFVGLTGEGKTSIINFIFSQGVESKGFAYFMNEKTDLQLIDISRYIFYISQDSYILNTNLYENINLGKIIKNYEEKIELIIKSLKLEKLKNRNLGINGKHISGGEKRKINMARFLYHINDFSFFILDEPFTSLDNITKDEVVNILLHKLKGKSGIIISHDLKTLKTITNDFIVLEKDKMLTGNYEKLVEKSDIFKKLISFI